MSRVCAITGTRPVKGRKIIHKGQSKKSGGIGLQLVGKMMQIQHEMTDAESLHPIQQIR